MLFLLFSIHNQRYALQSENIIEVIPNILNPSNTIQSRTVGYHQNKPRYPHSFAGFINYHQRLIPVIDLCLLKTETACRKQLSSRIILIHYPDGNGNDETLGLLTEKVTETIKVVLKEKENIFTHGDREFLLIEKNHKMEEVEIFKPVNLLPDSFDIFSQT